MAIQITGSKVKPVTERDHVFVRSIEITQRRDRDDATPANYTVRVAYQMYGVNADGLREYDDVMESIDIDDFLAKSNGKTKRLAAMAAIEEAIADILADDAGIDSATVS